MRSGKDKRRFAVQELEPLETLQLGARVYQALLNSIVSGQGRADTSHSPGCFPMTRIGSLSCPRVNQLSGRVLCNLYTKCRRGFGRLFPVLTTKTQYNLTNAREYFEEHLCIGD